MALEKKYDIKLVEKNKYQSWLNKGLFAADDKSSKPSFTIPIPPPNITGKLHLGHAWDGTLQDIVARYKKLNGFNVLLLPGLDHAGISMQRKVEERLRDNGIDTKDLSSDEFMNMAMDWKIEHEDIIKKQWAKLGLAFDYSKEKYTMDEDMNYAVYCAFVKMYESGVIYRGKKVVNWDPIQKTAISNMEVIHKEIKGKFYYFKYQIVDSDEFLEVATTRPETMFGDVCLAINPQDKKYKNLIGKKVVNPANKQKIPIIGDEYVDIRLGTGAMKITPGHDFNDFEIAKKHNLDMPVVMNPDGTMNNLANGFEGQDRFECRENIVAKIKKDGYLIKIEDKEQNIGHSERSGAIIEPLLSNQWFVNMQKIAKEALEFQKSKEGKVTFYPARFEKVYINWMENVYDWCISRKLKWGHQIPAWIHNETKEIYVGINPPQDIENYTKETDVLDTWFSSGLWAFSTLGWPDEKNPLFKKYFPTSLLVTGYDIIFFWVSRMMFQSQQFTGKKPFNDVLIHGLVRASDGQKMSKSLENGVDPNDVIDKYGADALRYFLATNSSPGLDLRYDETKVASSWNFINKIWNIARYTKISIDSKTEAKLGSNLSEIELWIVAKFNKRIVNIKSAMEKYEFTIANQEIFTFVYDELASVFIELSKVEIEKGNSSVKNTLLWIVVQTMIALHPYIPFVTEHIYQSFYPQKSIMEEQYPSVIKVKKSNIINKLNSLILAIRRIRADNQIKISSQIKIDVKIKDFDMTFDIKEYLTKLVNAKVVKIQKKDIDTIPFDYGSININLNQYTNFEVKIKTLNSKLEKLNKEIEFFDIKLSNKQFIQKAPDEVVDKFKDQKEKVLKQIKILKTEIKNIKK